MQTRREKLSDLPMFTKSADKKISDEEKAKSLPISKPAFFEATKQGDVFLHEHSVLPVGLVQHARELLFKFIRTTSGGEPDIDGEDTYYTYPNHTTNRSNELERVIGGYIGLNNAHFGLAKIAHNANSLCITELVKHINALTEILQPTQVAWIKIKMTHSIVKAIYQLTRAYYELMQSPQPPRVAPQLTMPDVLKTCDKALLKLQSPADSPRAQMLKEISDNLYKIENEIVVGKIFQDLVKNTGSVIPSLLNSYHQAGKILKVVLTAQQDTFLNIDLTSERKTGLLIKVFCRLVNHCCEYNNALGTKSSSWMNLIGDLNKLIYFLTHNDKGVELVTISAYRAYLITLVMETTDCLVRIFCRAIDEPEFIYLKRFSVRLLSREIERFATSRSVEKTTTSEARASIKDSLDFAESIITNLHVSRLLHENYNQYRGQSTTVAHFTNNIVTVSRNITNIEVENRLKIPQERKLLFLVSLMCKLIESYRRRLKRYPNERPTTKMWLKLMAEIKIHKSNFANVSFTDLEEMLTIQERALQRILFNTFRTDRTKIMELISAYSYEDKAVQLFAPNPLNISDYPFEMLGLVMIRHQEVLKIHFRKPENKRNIDYDAEEIATVFIAATLRNDMNVRLQELAEITHSLFGYQQMRETFMELLMNVQNAKLCGNFISVIVTYDQNIYQSQHAAGYLLTIEDLAYILQLLINHGLNTADTCPIDNTLLFAWMQENSTLSQLILGNFDDCLTPEQRAKMIDSPVRADDIKPDLTVDVSAEQNGSATLFFLSSKEKVASSSPDLASEPDTQAIKTPTPRGSRVFNFGI